MEAEKMAPEMLEEMTDIISDICRRSSPKITKDWLLDNVELPTLINFIQFVFTPVTERMKSIGIGSEGSDKGDQGEPGKN